jgi:hypothetical protein
MLFTLVRRSRTLNEVCLNSPFENNNSHIALCTCCRKVKFNHMNELLGLSKSNSLRLGYHTCKKVNFNLMIELLGPSKSNSLRLSSANKYQLSRYHDEFCCLKYVRLQEGRFWKGGCATAGTVSEHPCYGFDHSYDANTFNAKNSACKTKTVPPNLRRGETRNQTHK